jgi:hypothetical protein
VRIFYPGCAPAGGFELRLDQLEAIYRVAHVVGDTAPGAYRSALVGAGMGSGKTVVSIEVMLKLQPDRCLIVGVRDSYSQWNKTLKEQQGPAGHRRLLRIDNTVPGQDNLAKLLNGDPGWFYVGLEMLRSKDWEMVSETIKHSPEVRRFFGAKIEPTFQTEPKAKQKHIFKKMKPLDLLISDEAHKHSNQKSNSIKTIEDVPALAKIALSGTFFGNRFENAWSLSVWLWNKTVIGTKGMFEARYCVKVPVMTKDGRKQIKTKSGFPVSKIIGERNPGEFVETLPCYVFIATPIGPVPAAEVVRVKLGREEARQYGEMERQSLTWIPTTISAKREPLVADLPVTQRQRLRTAALGGMTLVPRVDPEKPDSITFMPNCKSSTLNAAYAVLHRPDWVGKKALILTHSKPFAIETARRIGQKYTVALKTGAVSSAQWEIDKARFMLPVSETNSVQYLVAVISAVGTSTDGLQTECAKVLWLSEDDNNINNVQGANRVWREGVNLDEYAAVKLVQEGTIAEGVLKKNRAHKKRTMASVQGAR